MYQQLIIIGKFQEIYKLCACTSININCFNGNRYKYNEGNNRPSSVNQISLVHNHDKAGNKCYTQDNTNTRANPRVRIGA